MPQEIVGRHHEEHRDLQADVLKGLHDRLPVDAGAVAAPLEQHAGHRGVVAQADNGVLGRVEVVGAHVMVVTKVPEDPFERVPQGPGVRDSRVHDQDREHALVRHAATPAGAVPGAPR